MHSRTWVTSALGLIVLIVATDWVLAQAPAPSPAPAPQAARRNDKDLLYVGVHGTQRNPDAYGGGLLVFDVANNFRFIKRIPTWDYPASQQNEGVRGIAASVVTGLLYVTTAKRIGAFDMTTEKKVWEGTYDGHCCDRMAISPDGKTLYIPQWTGPREKWYVVDAITGTLHQGPSHAPGHRVAQYDLHARRFAGVHGRHLLALHQHCRSRDAYGRPPDRAVQR